MKVSLAELKRVDQMSLFSGKVKVVEKYDRTIGVIIDCARKLNEREFVEILFSPNYENLVDKVIRNGTYIVALCIEKNNRHYVYTFEAFNPDVQQTVNPNNTPRQPRPRNRAQKMVEPKPSPESDYELTAKLKTDLIQSKEAVPSEKPSQVNESELVHVDGRKVREEGSVTPPIAQAPTIVAPSAGSNEAPKIPSPIGNSTSSDPLDRIGTEEDGEDVLQHYA